MSDPQAVALAEQAVSDAQTALYSAVAVLDHLSSDPDPGPDPGPVPGGVLHGSSSEKGSGSDRDAFTSLERSLVDASGQDGPVLMLDHRYDGDTIPRAIPSWWPEVGLRFGMLNGKGPASPTSSAFANLEPLAASLPEGFTLYLNWWHEPEDNMTAEKFTTAFAGFVDAVLGLDNLAEGASIVPAFNLHGSQFRQGSMYEKWGPCDSWNPYPLIPEEDWPSVLATINGYADPGSADVGKGEDPAWCFGPGFDAMRSWGATRLGVGEWGVQPAGVQAAYVTNAGAWFDAQGDVEVCAYFSSGVGGNAGTEGWFLRTDEALAAFADVCLGGRRE